MLEDESSTWRPTERSSSSRQHEPLVRQPLYRQLGPVAGGTDGCSACMGDWSDFGTQVQDLHAMCLERLELELEKTSSFTKLSYSSWGSAGVLVEEAFWMACWRP